MKERKYGGVRRRTFYHKLKLMPMARKKNTQMNDGDAEAHARRLAKSLPGIGSIPIRMKCKNKTQKKLIQSIREKDITIVSGPAGTGKSYCQLYQAISLLKEFPEEYKKLMLIYPTEEDDSEAVGFLPGSIEEKMSVWARPDLYTIEKIINESTGKEEGKRRVEEMIQQGLIEIHPTTFLRGLTIDNAIICVNEVQNFTKDQLLKILTRVGEFSKLIIAGDSLQISAKSIKKGKKESGLLYALEVLQGMEEVGIIEFSAEDIVRNPLIQKLLYRWDPETYSYLKDAPGIREENKEDEE